ncbi:MAG: PHP domain-containing protein [Candidatus Nanopelagicaceae bacterium]|nr:PHP domain-containing protein [Candidatus Nanopelagicaceae bacterium]
MQRTDAQTVPSDVSSSGPTGPVAVVPSTVILPPGPTEFVHLHSHTLFSTLDGIASPRQYLEKSVERKWPAAAFTEHGNMASVPDAYFSARELGIKPILGCEIYYNDDHHRLMDFTARGGKIREYKKSEDPREQEQYQRLIRNRHLTVLCRNLTGYRNLLHVMRTAWEEGMYRRPRVWFDLLAKHKEGLVILSGCLSGPTPFELRRYEHWMNEDQMTGNKKQLAEECLRRGVASFVKFKKTFGDDFYVELQMPGVPGDVTVFKKMLELADKTKTKTVLTADTHYMVREDHFIQVVMMAIDQDTTVTDPELFHVNSDEQFYKSRAELRHTFMTKEYSAGVPLSEFERACDGTLEVADKVEKIVFDVDPKFPHIDDAPGLLRRKCAAALVKKGLHKNEQYTKRLKLELDRIIEKGFADYFIITQDIVNFSRSHGENNGTGRGSVGGCLVAYLLGIHSLDSIKWNLSFDRFLSSSRGGIMLKVTM